MLIPAIQNRVLTKTEIKDLVNFLAYHLGYTPYKYPKVIFAKDAKHFAELYEGYKLKGQQHDDLIDEINRDTRAFFDHWTDTVVFQGFSYINEMETEVPEYIVPMSMILHELIHFFQYTTSNFGSYRILYEGTNDILSTFLANDQKIDYVEEAVYSFNIAMEINDHNFWRALQWMKVFTVHSNKNTFVHRTMKTSPGFCKYNVRKLLKNLDAGEISEIKNKETLAILTRYSLKRILALCKQNYKIILGL